VDKQVQASPAADKAALAGALAGMKDDAAGAKAWVDRFTTAGGRRVYVVGSAGALIFGAPPLFVVPVEPGGDPAAVARMFDPAFGQPAAATGPATRPAGDAAPGGPDSREPGRAVEASVAEVVGRVVVFGPRKAINQGKVAKPIDRPAFAQALAACGEGAAVRVAIYGAAVAGKAPAAAVAEQPAGLKDVEWVALAVSLPPDESASLIVQAKSPDAARAVADAFNEMLNRLGKNAQARAAVGDVGPIIEALHPETTDNRVTVRVGARAIEDVLAPAVVKAAAAEAKQREEYRRNSPPAGAAGAASTRPAAR
jgi:hypothetical protein